MSGFEMDAIWNGLEPSRVHTRNLNGDLTALNATVYGYGGLGAYIPMPTPQRQEQFTFWDQQKVNETVTRKYVIDNIGGGKAENPIFRKRLDTPMSTRKNFYLVLLELGVPAKIFQIVDGSWGDDDLPVDAETVGELGLDNANLEKRFLKKQHMFLLRLLGAGDHVDYSEDETVAIQCASTRRPVNVNMNVNVNMHMGINGLSAPAVVALDKVYFPWSWAEFYMRMQVPLGDGGDGKTIRREIFLEEIAASKAVLHKHIVKIHASYTHQDYGYILLTPACELNLSQFIKYTPYSFKSIPKDRRRKMLLEWLHCLADALAYMYERGVAHRAIHPRSIVIDQTNYNILFADIVNFKRLDLANRSLSIDVEVYDYAAPELWQRAMTSFGGSSPTGTTFSGRAFRKSSSNASSTGSIAPTVAAYTGPGSGNDIGEPITPIQSHSTSISSGLHVGLYQWIATSNNPSKSDVFSLGCIFLDIATLLLKKRSSAFIAHRSRKQRRPRQSATPDQSFHANLSQVEIWIDELEREVERKQDLTVSHVLRLIRSMLARDPSDRPHPRQVSHALYKTLEAEFILCDRPPVTCSSTSTAGEGGLHCEPTCDSPVSQLGMVAELKLWPTSTTQRTSAASSSSGSSSGSTVVKIPGDFSPWEEDILEGEEPKSRGQLSVAHMPCSDVSGHSGRSSAKAKPLSIKRSVVRLFGFIK
ncbi:kinase-like domain-containing protein [Tirmania nivea]|nr:kinase-like domain-containing protein [Tirmania nivea]